MYYCVRTASTWIFTAQPDGTPLMRLPDEVETLLPIGR